MVSFIAQHSQQSLSLVRFDNLPATNWPWGGEPILCMQSQKTIGNITSLGYDATNSNTIHALSVIDQSGRENNGSDDVMVRVGADMYKGSIIKFL